MKSCSFIRLLPLSLPAALLLVFAPVAGWAAPASLDLAFGAGSVLTSFNGGGAGGDAVAVQSDGKIVLAGGAGKSGGGSDFALLRYNPNGTLDPGFNGFGEVTTSFASFSGGPDSGANAVAVQADGKIVAAGRNYGGDNGMAGSIALARYNADGSLDKTFNGSGQVTTVYGSEATAAYALALQPDGKILVAGAYYVALEDTPFTDTVFLVARYNVDGSLDTSFNRTGVVTSNFAPGSASSIAVQSDGKIVVAGTVQLNSGQSAFATLRYNANGTLDNTFNHAGGVTTIFGTGFTEGNSVRIQADGKILVGGTVPGAAGSVNFGVVRYTTNGSLDTTFNGTGKVSVNLATDAYGNGSNDLAYAVALQSDGKIVLAGTTTAPVAYGDNAFGLVRLNSDGSLDTTFNGTGTVATTVGSGTSNASAAVVVGTEIIVVGSAFDGTYATFAAVKYQADGSLASTFNPEGAVETAIGFLTSDIPANDVGNAVAIAANGKILVAGSISNGSKDDFALVRYNANGTRDSSFNFEGDGKVVTDFGGRDDVGNSIALQPDGKILVAGTSNNGSNDDFALARYNTDGSLNLKVTTDVSGGDDDGAGVAVQSDGKIVVAGTSQSGGRNVFAVVRYNPDGSLDTTFGGAGKVLTSIGSGNSFGKGVALQNDGKILVVGYAYGIGNYDFALVRYNANGSLDTSFVVEGKDTTAIGHRDDLGESVAVQPDGKILVAGVSYTDTIFVSSLVRYNSSGALDVSFNPASRTGTISVAVGPGDYTGTSLALQPDGKIVLAGTASYGSASWIAVQRYTSNGVPDTDFNGNGQVLTAFNSAAFGHSVALQANGNIVVGGATFDGPYEDFAVVRYIGGQ